MTDMASGRNIVSLERLDERFSYTVRFRAVVRGRAGLEPHEPREGDRLVRRIGAAVVRKPFDGGPPFRTGIPCRRP